MGSHRGGPAPGRRRPCSRGRRRRRRRRSRGGVVGRGRHGSGRGHQSGPWSVHGRWVGPRARRLDRRDQADLGGLAAHLPDARLRPGAGRLARPRPGHRLHRDQARGGAGAGLPPHVSGQAGCRRAGAWRGAVAGDDADRRVSGRPGLARLLPGRGANAGCCHRRFVDSSVARGAVPGGQAGRGLVAGRAHRLGGPWHQGPRALAAGRSAGCGPWRRAGGVAAHL